MNKKAATIATALLICFYAGALTRTVCPSGCDFTSFSTAVAASGPTDIIELQADLTEVYDLNSNIAAVQSDTGARVWDGSDNFALLELRGGFSQALTIRSVVMKQTGSGSCLKWTNYTAGATIVAESATFWISGNGDDCIEIIPNLPANTLTIEGCQLIGNVLSEKGLHFLVSTTANQALMYNSIIRDVGEDAVFGDDNTANDVFKLYNTTIDNCAAGVKIQSGADIKNVLFTNNTDDVSLSGSASDSDFTYCAFEEQGSPFGSNNVFSITSTDEYVNEGANDFHLKAGADSIDAGVSIVVVTDDYDGVARPQGAAYDIGAYEYMPVLGAGSLMLLRVGY